jgi:hypothetical protein
MKLGSMKESEDPESRRTGIGGEWDEGKGSLRMN